MFPPVDDVIRREVNSESVESLDFISSLINEYVDFGSNMLFWGIAEINKKEKSHLYLPPKMMLRNMLEVLDAIAVLLKQGTGDPAKILARTILEQCLYIDYMFDNEFEKKSMSFLTVDLINRRNNLIRENPKTLEGKKFYEYILESGSNYQPSKQEIEILENSTRKFDIELEEQNYKEYIIEYELTKGNRKYAKWYNLFNGPKTLSDLAKNRGLYSLYQTLYSDWSGNTHSTDIMFGKIENGKKGEIFIHNIRSVKDIQQITLSILPIVKSIFSVYFDFIIPNHKERYNQWQNYIKPKFKKLIEMEKIKF